MNRNMLFKICFFFLISLIIVDFPVYAADWTSGNIASKTYSSNETINLSGTVTLTGTITINSGATLTIQGAGTLKRGTSNTSTLFKINDGGALVIKGTTGNSDDIVINGNRSNVTASGTIFDCYEKLSLTNVTMKNNYNTGNTAGAITARAYAVNISVTNCVITNCYSKEGSAIYLKGAGSGPVNLTKTIIQNCEAEGGTIRTNGGGNWQLTVKESVVRNNVSTGHGGGFYWNANGTNAKLQIDDVHIIGNSATEKGGGLFLEGSNMVLSSSTGTATEAILTGNIPSEGIVGTLIQGNTSQEFGGGIYISGYGGGSGVGMSSTDSFNLNLTENVVVKGNSAPNGGGIGLHLNQADPEDGYTYNIIIDGAVLNENIAETNGAAIYCQLNYDGYNVNVTMNDGTVLNNEAQNGSAFYVAGCTFEMNGGTLSGNISTADGGAIYVTDSDSIGCSFNMTGGTLTNNTATGNGGAIYLSGGDFTMTNGTISNNVSKGNGGGVFVSGGDFTMTNGVISDNEASLNGGGIYAGSESESIQVEVSGGEIVRNKAAQHGGAIDVNMATGLTAEVIIGVEACKGNDPTQHAEGAMCPNLEENRALESGGGICIHGDTDKVTVNMYCGVLQNNVAVEDTVSGNMNQTGGTYIISGGTLGNNILLLGGEFIDLRENIEQITIRYHSNYGDGTTETYVDTLVVVGSIINLPGNVFTRDGHYLSGWTTNTNDEVNGYMPVNASYEVMSIEEEQLDLYAVWDASFTYIIMIPAEIEINNTLKSDLTISAEFNYFTEAASLSLKVSSYNNFKLMPTYEEMDSFDYTLSVDGTTLENDSVIVVYKYDNIDDVVLEAIIDEVNTLIKYAGDYEDTLTFTVEYSDGLSV